MVPRLRVHPGVCVDGTAARPLRERRVRATLAPLFPRDVRGERGRSRRVPSRHATPRLEGAPHLRIHVRRRSGQVGTVGLRP